jgi:hypothetical protein
MDQTINPVTEPKSRYRPLAGRFRTMAVFAGVFSACGVAWPQAYLDLTTPISESSEGPRGFPGGRIGNSAAAAPLPVEVTLQDLYPTGVEASGRLTALVLIRNVGKGPLAVPASRDFGVLKAGNQGQRMLHVSLTITPPPPLKPILLTVGSVAGSTSVPGSLIILAPQESVEIRVQAPLLESSRWHDAGLDTANVKVSAGITENDLESEEFAIRNGSPTVRSKNEIEIFWHH